MNIDFQFPAEFAQRVFGAALGPESDPGFTQPLLGWRVLGAFSEVLTDPAFKELHAYTVGDHSALKQYQLAQRVAAVFDRYLVYRPEWLCAWAAGEASHWQAKLWRKLASDRSHPPAQLRQLRERIARKPASVEPLP